METCFFTVDFTERLKDQRVRIGNTAEFSCVITEAKAIVTWYCNGVKLRKSSKYEMISNGDKHMLRIKNVKPEDEGEITARAELEDFDTTETAAKLCHLPEGMCGVKRKFNNKIHKNKISNIFLFLLIFPSFHQHYYSYSFIKNILITITSFRKETRK